ncbi:hypothetical protein C8R45DRAFT_191836 [Mycena sanguinolenta]|nr:hypothetical protein C8R45DRAFT_191836 [Mycena sanguinolenta]
MTSSHTSSTLQVTSGLGQTAETAATLWQFGTSRLLLGQTTLPLQPLGTADNDAATTYLYQVQNSITTVTTDARGVVANVPTVSATPRTIVISASGWYEIFETHGAVSCGYIDATFGQCQNLNSVTTTLANSGTPTPVVIPISRFLNEISVPSAFTSSASEPRENLSFLVVPTTDHSLTSTASLPNNTPPPTQTSDAVEPAKTPQTNDPVPGAVQHVKKPPVAAIVGGVLGALMIATGAVIMLWWCRRRRLSRVANEVPRAYSGPDSGVLSDVPTSELVRTLYDRTRDRNMDRSPSPPQYFRTTVERKSRRE